ncbi:unnamed protein product [Miscanthus lutarioriparius]|uniref:Leucine-rich repeat-containing N-terminal plant-type domain-containing protein n=1 Tax=Miscanthus lutarioriparius TaxID=422564 RepID=A0A811PGY2_9POAL|nr:unnamed protein product [Miscanthus lutarioriparius]
MMMVSINSHRQQLMMYLHLLVHLFLGIQHQLSHSLATYSNQTTIPPAAAVPCRPDQSAALLRLRRSFSATTTTDSTRTLASWRPGTDCCRWEGIACATADGRVTTLDLAECGLQSAGLHPALFELTSLRYLDLSFNSFNESELPAVGFELLTELTYLNLSYTDFIGNIPHGIRRLNKLVSLDFTNWIYLVEGDNDYFLPLGEGRWPIVEPNIGSFVANLSNLKELYLGNVDLSGNGATWCSAFANSTPQLQVLSLPNTHIDAPICESLSSIRSLTMINLNYNKVYGQIPESFADLPSLSVLKLAYNRLEGRFPMRIFQNINLTAVDVSYNSKVLHQLTFTRSSFPLQLVSGAGIVGEIPSWVANLTSLETLQFSNCGLSGQVPSFISNLKNLIKLKLYACNFSGQIPPHLFNLTQLGIVNLHSNSFSGTIQLNSFFEMPNLVILNLSNNKLSVVDGEYNSSWASIQNFDTLCLASCNISKLPNTLKHMYFVEVLDLSNNHIHGPLPQWAWDNWINSLILMNISHNQFSSGIGYGPVIFANIFVIDISYNRFEGPIPIPGPQNQLFDCSNNQFSSMPFNFGSHLSSISLLMAHGNKLSGEIPQSICEATSLMLLDLSNNDLIGSIPSCLMEDMSRLNVLNLKGNQLHGRLPNSLKQDCAFEALDFSDNQIEGQLPRSLVACKDLEVFDIGKNLINDTFPCWMSMLPKLQVLVLKSNRFMGDVGPSISEYQNSFEFGKVQIIDLASNNFSGLLRNKWFTSMGSMMTKDVNETLVMENQYDLLGQTYQFTTAITYKGSDISFSKILRTIVIIDVSNNEFYGTIPESIGDLVLLGGLNMSHNALIGPIPSQLGMLHQLESLDLSSNELSGEIP